MKKTKRKKTPAALPIPKNKKPVAGRTAQKSRKAAPVKKRRAKQESDATKKSGYPIKGGSVLKKVAPFREIPSEDPPPVPPVEGEPPRYLPIRPLASQQTAKTSADTSNFDCDYIPLDATQRRARKGLLWQWVQTKDPLVAATLKRQEEIEIPYREAMAGVFGKKAGWREAIIIEARHDERCSKELGQWLSRCAVSGGSEELDAFSKAVESVCRAEEVGPVNRKFVCGLMFVLRCQIETGCLPPQNKVRQFLKELGFVVEETEKWDSPEPRKNEARDLFKGPIMGNLPKGKAGRPRKLSS